MLVSQSNWYRMPAWNKEQIVSGIMVKSTERLQFTWHNAIHQKRLNVGVHGVSTIAMEPVDIREGFSSTQTVNAK